MFDTEDVLLEGPLLTDADAVPGTPPERGNGPELRVQLL